MNDKIVCIIDYGLGNLTSVKNAVESIGLKVAISCDIEVIQNATHLILPGVGSFGEGMAQLQKRNIIDTLSKEVLDRRKPILGICLGMHLFASDGFEFGRHRGLGWIPGQVVRIDNQRLNLRLPHIGWNNVHLRDGHLLGKGFGQEPIFYFAHSFHFRPENSLVVAGTCDYGHEIVAMIEQDNICGCQFHPEKSHIDGIQILKNFIFKENDTRC